MMLGKRKAVPMLPPSKKKRKTTPAIEEINFDLSAREDYLTGFHKRKLQRTKRAKEEAAKKEREEKIAARKLVSLLLAFELGKSNAIRSCEKGEKQTSRSMWKQ